MNEDFLGFQDSGICIGFQLGGRLQDQTPQHMQVIPYYDLRRAGHVQVRKEQAGSNL